VTEQSALISVTVCSWSTYRYSARHPRVGHDPGDEVAADELEVAPLHAHRPPPCWVSTRGSCRDFVFGAVIALQRYTRPVVSFPIDASGGATRSWAIGCPGCL